MTWSVTIIILQLIVVKWVFLELSLFPGLLFKDPSELRVASNEPLHACAIILLLGRYSIPEPLVLVIELDRAAILDLLTFESVVDLIFGHVVVLLHSDFVKPPNNQL